MAKVLVTDTKLTAIGDAIREKTGSSDKMTLDEMPDKIRAIEGGGSSTSSGLFTPPVPYLCAYIVTAQVMANANGYYTFKLKSPFNTWTEGAANNSMLGYGCGQGNLMGYHLNVALSSDTGTETGKNFGRSIMCGSTSASPSLAVNSYHSELGAIQFQLNTTAINLCIFIIDKNLKTTASSNFPQKKNFLDMFEIPSGVTAINIGDNSEDFDPNGANWLYCSYDMNNNTYNVIGYKEGFRVRSGGEEAESFDSLCTGFIPFKQGDTLRIVPQFKKINAQNCINFSDKDFANLGQAGDSGACYGICNANYVPKVTSGISQLHFNEKLSASVEKTRITHWKIDLKDIKITVNNALKPEFTNMLNYSTAYYKRGYRYSLSGGAFTASANECAIVIPGKPGTHTVRVRGVEDGENNYWNSFYFGATNTSFTLSLNGNDPTQFTRQVLSNKDWVFTYTKDSTFSYIVLHVYNTFDIERLQVIFDEEFTYQIVDENYLNLVNTNHTEFVKDYRLNSTGGLTAATGIYTTNMIGPFKNGDTIRVKGLDMSAHNLATYSADRTTCESIYPLSSQYHSNISMKTDELRFTYTSNSTCQNGYLRFSGKPTGNIGDVIVTVNEVINEDYPTETVSAIEDGTRMSGYSYQGSCEFINSNTEILFGTTVANECAISTRESTTIYPFKIPSWATGVCVHTTDSAIQKWTFMGFNYQSGTKYLSFYKEKTTDWFCNFAPGVAQYMVITGVNDSTSFAWNYDASKVKVTFVGPRSDEEVNLLPLSTDAYGLPFNNGQGWKTGYRLNSSGTETALINYEVTGYMPAVWNGFVYARDTGTDSSYVTATFYDVSKKVLTGTYISTIMDMYVDGVYFGMINQVKSNAITSATKYMRFSNPNITNETLISTKPIAGKTKPYLNLLEAVGYEENKRLDSSGNVVAANTQGSDVTGLIPFTAGNVIRLKNIEIPSTYKDGVYWNIISFYGVDKKQIKQMYLSIDNA